MANFLEETRNMIEKHGYKLDDYDVEAIVCKCYNWKDPMIPMLRMSVAKFIECADFSYYDNIEGVTVTDGVYDVYINPALVIIGREGWWMERDVDFNGRSVQEFWKFYQPPRIDVPIQDEYVYTDSLINI